ncbi:MAG: lysine 2,3-aminomutase [Alphaproteobacteria bacterium]|jgi:lysine 2,3-aminomutase|nr:lysine 2,3-aminomutase [Alphaproteobacteria bacterium]
MQTKRQPIPLNDDPALAEVMERYAVAVTDEVMELIDATDPADPIAKQYLPTAEELKTTPDELEDPIGDDVHSPVKGIVHRYPDRVLLKAVHVCAVYCRFCFRREKVGPGSEMLNKEELQKALAYIRNMPAIWEVILTGGDPFVLSPRRLREIMEALNEIPHVQVIRFHTRVPVADPSRVPDELVEALQSDKAVYVVFHANHPRELTDKVKAVAQKFIKAGIPLLSQSTLLKGVNNDAAVLEQLFRAFTAMKVKPYYLHHPDLAPGTGHFRLSIKEGQELTAQLQGKMSGIAQPHYMLDIPGGHGKVPVSRQWLAETEDGYDVTDFRGNTHKYK